MTSLLASKKTIALPVAEWPIATTCAEQDSSCGPLGHTPICDFSGQLAGVGATKFLVAFGAQVIRIEDPVRQGRWDILRGRRRSATSAGASSA